MTVEILIGDARERLRDLPDESVHCVVTSPPYWGLRQYGSDSGMIGLEPTLDEHLENLVAVFREVHRVLRADGSLWLNYGDAYASSGGAGTQGGSGQMADRSICQACSPRPTPGFRPKELMGLPWRLAFALQADGWWLRRDHIWHKPNPTPESAGDRATTSHEYVFLLTKAAHYFYDAEAVKEKTTGNAHRRAPAVAGWDKGPGAHGTIHRNPREKPPGVPPKSAPAGSGIRSNNSFQAAVVDTVATRNLRSVWTIPTRAFKGAHFATFPPELCEIPVKAGTSETGVCHLCGAPWEPTTTPTVGWKAGCGCSVVDEVLPAVVLDPFAGAGTVGLVADRLGRDAILIEINPDYAQMAHERIGGDAPLFTTVRKEATA